MPLRTSARETSCGVETITVPVWATYVTNALPERKTQTVNVNKLPQREWDIPCPGWHVYHENVETRTVWICAAPVNVEKQLLHCLLYHETAPGHWGIGTREKEPNGHGRQTVVRKWEKGTT